MSRSQPALSNLEALDRFWRRSSFHDELIDAIDAVHKRVIIRLAEMTLVVTGASSLERCDLPAVWLDQTITPNGRGFVLEVETDNGRLMVTDLDIRLIRNADLALLIPPVDP